MDTEVPASPWPRNDRLSRVLPLLHACAVGLGVFFLFGGISMIDPTRTDWLMTGDPSQHYIGWVYFRDTPLLQFPVGANPLFGGKIASSIVFSDSIPLFAIPFKLLGPLLPRPFQYFGLWIAFCFCMQAFFSFKVLRKLEMSVEVAAIGSALLVLAPAMLWRLYGHEALLGHWLLLAGVSLYLDPRWRGGAWLVLLLAAVMVHGYLVVMVAGIWVADLSGRFLGWHGTGRPDAWSVLAAAPACILLMWALGYFMVPSYAGLTARDAGFGLYKSDIATFVDSDGTWSYILPDIPDSRYGDEGFGFLGLGSCALLALFVIVHIRRKRFPRVERRCRALFWLAAAFALYALSNRIAIANETIASIPLPHFLDPFLVTFRASGRFIWLPAHLMVVTLVVFLARWIGNRRAAVILACLVAAQIADLQSIAGYFRARFAEPWQNPALAGFWTEAAGKYRRIAFVPADPWVASYIPMASLAAENGLETNVAYLARQDPAMLVAAQEDALATAATGRLDRDTLYVFSDDALYGQAASRKADDTLAATVDGFKLLAPAWNGCTETCGAAPSGPN